MEFVCNGGSWIPLTTEKKKNALCGQSNHVVSGKIFRDFMVKIPGSKIKQVKESAS